MRRVHVLGGPNLGRLGRREPHLYGATTWAELETLCRGWAAGLDLELMDNTYLVFEGGKLFEDTDTSANAFQFSSGIRYEF